MNPSKASVRPMALKVATALPARRASMNASVTSQIAGVIWQATKRFQIRS